MLYLILLQKLIDLLLVNLDLLKQNNLVTTHGLNTARWRLHWWRGRWQRRRRWPGRLSPRLLEPIVPIHVEFTYAKENSKHVTLIVHHVSAHTVYTSISVIVNEFNCNTLVFYQTEVLLLALLYITKPRHIRNQRTITIELE